MHLARPPHAAPLPAPHAAPRARARRARAPPTALPRAHAPPPATRARGVRTACPCPLTSRARRIARASYIMLDATVGALGFYLLGYGFAYGDKMRCAPHAAAARTWVPYCRSRQSRLALAPDAAAAACARPAQRRRQQRRQRLHRLAVLCAQPCAPAAARAPPHLARRSPHLSAPLALTRARAAAGLPYAKGKSQFYNWRVPPRRGARARAPPARTPSARAH
jgi:hypothetical protein